MAGFDAWAEESAEAEGGCEGAGAEGEDTGAEAGLTPNPSIGGPTPGSAVAEWGLTSRDPLGPKPAGVCSREFEAKSRQAMKALCERHGGVATYLEERLSTPAAKCEFFSKLLALFPLDDTMAYHDSNPLPVTAPEELSSVLPLKLHIGMLSYGRLSSLKPDPESDTVLQLLDEFLADGFLTAGDPRWSLRVTL